jgi:hypothetical protein
MAAIALSGPRKIIELDGKPELAWRLDSSAVHLWKGKLWKWEAVGCICCIEEEGLPHETLSTVEGDEVEYECMTHGVLERVEYVMRKDFVVTLGGVTRTGFEEITDAMLFPKSMSEDEKLSLINKILDEIEEDEHTTGEEEEAEGDEDEAEGGDTPSDD